MEIPEQFLINDARGAKQFENESFSKYYKKEVLTQFKKNVMDKRLEEAVNWCIELMLSLHTYKVYEILVNIACKYININNPQLPVKLYNRYKLFLSKNLTEPECRNSQVIRNQLIELCIIVCLSTKGKALSFYKIKDSEFDLENIVNRLGSKTNHITNIVKKNDPEEIVIMLNEFCDNIKKKNYEKAIYWLSLVIEYEKNYTKKNKQFYCNNRNIEGIDPKYQSDVIWFIWTIILNEANTLLQEKANIQVNSLFKLYKFQYKPSKKYKNCQYIFYALKYFTYNFNINQAICIDNYLSIQITSYINILFKQKQDNEVTVIKDYVKEKKIEQPIHKKKSKKILTNKQKFELNSQQKFDLLNKLDNMF